MSKALPIGKTLCFTLSVKHLDQKFKRKAFRQNLNLTTLALLTSVANKLLNEAFPVTQVGLDIYL